MSLAAFEVERIRLEVARSLPANCFDDFLRLSRTLLHGPGFQWLLVDAPHELLRKQVMAALNQVLRAAGLTVNRLPLSRQIADVAELEQRLLKIAGTADVVQVIGPPGWFDSARWDAFNVRRERIAAGVRARLVFWLNAEAIALASTGAPDLWAWRGGVYAFVPLAPAVEGSQDATVGVPIRVPGPVGVDSRSMTERSRRIAEIQSWLDSHPAVPDDLLIAPYEELGRLLFELGEYDAALAHWVQRELPLHRRLGDQRGVAVMQGRIADLLQERGDYDEALRILQHEVLPVYERLGDVRSRAVTQGKIADALQMRGPLDEVLRIRREEELPVFERLGDVRERAVTQGKIADVLQMRGQWDEALRIRREEELPVYERLGDVRSRALTQGKITDVLQARGQWDEALRILRKEVLPVLERLGDVRGRAVMQGKIADVLHARGQLDEALRIRREEELPVYERLGDVRARAMTQGQIGLQLLDAGGADAAEGKQCLEAAWADLSRKGLPEAQVLAEQMRQRGLSVPDA